jgi:hypothetical protein
VDVIFVPWLWADVNMAGERQLFPHRSADLDVSHLLIAVQ